MQPFFPSAAVRHAAQVEHAFVKLCEEFFAIGKKAPSLEVLNEEQRRHPTHSILDVIERHRVELR